MKMRKVTALAVSLVLGASMLAACGGGDKTEAAASAASAASSAEAETATENAGRDDVKIQFYEEPPTADNHNDASISTGIIGANINASLFKLSEDGEPVGALADSWEWNDDFTAVTITLKDDIKFSDGSDITAEDVVFSMERGKEAGFSTYYAYIDSVTANGDKEVTFSLTQPYAVFLYALSTVNFPVLSKAAIEGGMDIGRTPNVTSGPYYIEAWNVGSDMVLKANEYYYEGAPEIKTADLIFMGDENTALTALQSGDIDFMMSILGLTGSAKSQVEDSEGLHTIPFLNTAYTFLSLNQDLEYFADENVRKAIDCAINRDDIILAAVDGMGTPASIPIQEGYGGYLDGYSPTAYDVDKAKEYMAASAYPDGFEFTVLCGTPAWKKVGTTIQSELAEIGITVNIEEQEVGTVVTNMFDGNYEAAIMSWSNACGDVSNLSPIYDTYETSLNLCNMKDSAIIDAMNKSFAVDVDERDEYLKEAYDAMMDQAQYISIYWPDGYYAAKDGLELSSKIGVIGEFLIKDMSWK